MSNFINPMFLERKTIQISRQTCRERSIIYTSSYLKYRREEEKKIKLLFWFLKIHIVRRKQEKENKKSDAREKIKMVCSVIIRREESK